MVHPIAQRRRVAPLRGRAARCSSTAASLLLPASFGAILSLIHFESHHSTGKTATPCRRRHSAYLELVPGERIRYTDRFDDPNLPGEMVTTVTLKAVSCGTDVSVVQESVPSVIPVEMCYLGWQESLAQLATLVEPAIPD